MSSSSNSRAKPCEVLHCLVAFAAPLVSLGILAALAASSGFRARSVAGTRRDILNELAREPADVLVLGVQLVCGSSVTALLAQLRVESASPKTVVLVPMVAAHICPVLRASGAAGTVPLEIEASKLPEILHACFRDAPMPAEEGLKPRSESTAGSVDLDLLTPCETEIFRQIGAGFPPRVIAARLGISPKTVEAHRANIKAKLGIRTAAAFNDIARACVLWESTGVDYVI